MINIIDLNEYIKPFEIEIEKFFQISTEVNNKNYHGKIYTEKMDVYTKIKIKKKKNILCEIIILIDDDNLNEIFKSKRRILKMFRSLNVSCTTIIRIHFIYEDFYHLLCNKK